MEAQIQSEPQVEIARVPKPVPTRGNADSFVDAALDFLEEEGPKRPSRQKPDAEAEPEGPGEEGDPGEEDLPRIDDDAEPEGEQEDDGEDESAHDGRGSKEQPFTLKDLPKDKFIELKVDGEKVTVPLDELANGYVREQTFSRRLNKTKDLATQAQQTVEQAQQLQQRVRTEFQTFVRDPEGLFEFFTATDERERVLETVARQYAAMRKHFRENPQAQVAWQRKRDEERLTAEREAWENQKRSEHEAAQRKAAHDRALSIFQPGWEKGLKLAGFPKPTKELYDEVVLRLQQRTNAGLEITPDDVATFVQRAAKLLELPPGGQKPRPAPQSPRADKRPTARRGDKDFSRMTPQQRRSDPDYFLKSLKPRDFR